MLSLAHTIISLPFAYVFDNPVLIFMASVIFHLLCDTLLHWNVYPMKQKIAFYTLVASEIMLGLILAWFIVGRDLLTLSVLAAIAGGNAPDVAHQLWELLPSTFRRRYLAWAQPLFTFHDHLQNETPHIARGLISQALLIGTVGLFFWLR